MGFICICLVTWGAGAAVLHNSCVLISPLSPLCGKCTEDEQEHKYQHRGECSHSNTKEDALLHLQLLLVEILVQPFLVLHSSSQELFIRRTPREALTRIIHLN